MIRSSRYRLGRHDRITFDGAHHRHVKAENGHHVFEVVVDDTAQNIFVVKSDDDLGKLFAARRCRIEEGHYSKACALLRVRHDTSDLTDLPENHLRTIAWREHWVKRLLALRQDLSASFRPKMTQADLARFIDAEKACMDVWYLETFGERRNPGRELQGTPRKPFDWPSPSTLKNWVRAYVEGGARTDALKTAYARCGRKPYLDERIRTIVERRAESYADSRQVLMDQIIRDVESDLAELAARTGETVTVSATTIRKAIRSLDAFKVTAGRKGVGFAERMFAPIGKGVQIPHPLGRVEIDDWTADLFVLTQKSSVWKSLTREQRALVPRVRVTITVAIDVATRCIVGFHMSTSDPSRHGSKTCLSRVLTDKNKIAQWAGCVALWVMAGRPEFVATDGGPAFLGDFEFAVARIRAPRVLPEQDPRLRGSIESFFRFFKRVCRYFAGQSFSNVIERGEYPSEQLAALTYEQFYKACIRFIVDFYHHRPHRGLEGGTPSAAWDRLVAKFGVAPPLSDAQVIQAFGLRTTRRLDQHGVRFEKLTFNSEPLNALLRKMAAGDVEIIVDPNDLSRVLVVIPKKWRGTDGLPEGDAIVVPEISGAGNDLTLAELATARADVRAFLAEEASEGRPIRLEAHRDLFDQGERTRREAGLPEFGLTQKQFGSLDRALARKSRAALDDVGHAKDPVTIDNQTGEIIAGAAKRPAQPQRGGNPFGGSINSFGDDV